MSTASRGDKKWTWRERANGILEMTAPNGTISPDFLQEALKRLDQKDQELQKLRDELKAMTKDRNDQRYNALRYRSVVEDAQNAINRLLSV